MWGWAGKKQRVAKRGCKASSDRVRSQIWFLLEDFCPLPELLTQLVVSLHTSRHCLGGRASFIHMFTHTVHLQGWPPSTVSLWHTLQNKPLASFRPASFQTLQDCARGLHVIVSFSRVGTRRCARRRRGHPKGSGSTAVFRAAIWTTSAYRGKNESS